MTLDEPAFLKSFESYWNGEGTEGGLRNAIATYMEEMGLVRQHEVALATKEFLNAQVAIMIEGYKERENG
jgi:hypothetical protein